jgi:uncharacterized LabA/DUF88 family protein
VNPPRTARDLARRHASLPVPAWAVLLDGLCTDAQLRTLVHSHLRRLPNRPLPRDRAGMIGALIPPADLPHDLLTEFVADLLRIAPPDAPPPTAEAALRALQEAPSPERYARALWACVCGPDPATAEAAAADAGNVVEAAVPEPVVSPDPGEVADAVVRALTPRLRTTRPSEDATRLLERIEQARTEIRALRGRCEATLTQIAKSLHDLASRPKAPVVDGLAGTVSSLLERHLSTPPAWADQVLRRLEDAEGRIRTLASDALSAPSPRAQREAWRLAHPDAPPRIALVADLENLTSSAREWRGRRLNFAALRERLGRGGEVTSAAAFAVETPGQAAFLAALRYAGWEPHVRPTTTAAGRPKANWDVGLTLHVVDLAPRVDVMALATGDGDFADLLDWLRGQGIQTRVAAVPEDTAAKLRVAADEFIPVDDALMMPAECGRAPDADGAKAAAAAS